MLRKQTLKRIYILSVFLILGFSLGYSSDQLSENWDLKLDQNQIPVVSVLDSPIEINGNLEILDYSTQGNGTVENPYIIEGLSINASTNHGIQISNVNAHLIVRDSYIVGGKTNGFNGINLNSCENVTLDNNTVSDNSNGIYVVTSNRNKIVNNFCFNNTNNGIQIYHYSSQNEITNNTCTYNSFGIYLYYSVGSTLVLNNYLSKNNYGVIMYDSTVTTITGNTFFNNSYGVSFFHLVTTTYVYGNFFVENQNEHVNFVATYSGAYFDNGSIGNYWDNYTTLYPNASLTQNGVIWNTNYAVGAQFDNFPLAIQSLIPLDTDNDGLSDSYEIYVLNTDAENSDSDNDGIPDGHEISSGMNPNIDDSEEDFDEDGLSNYEEYFYGLNVSNWDTDGDGMDDAWEIDNSLNPLVDDSEEDFDEDGLSNYEENFYGLNASNSDTDGDGMDDAWEIDNSLNPLVEDSEEDFDEDGLSNYEENFYGLNASNSDTDGDGMDDAWEIDNSLNPLVDDSEEDPDEDGLSNLEEYQDGKNPNIDESLNTDGTPDGIYYNDENRIPGYGPMALLIITFGTLLGLFIKVKGSRKVRK